MVNRKLFRPTLTEVKEQQFAPPRPAPPAPQQAPQPRKKAAPAEQTHVMVKIIIQTDIVAIIVLRI